MIFTEMELAGAFLVELEPSHDRRGSFRRTFCRETFLRHGLDGDVEQCNVSFNAHRGTLRGLHYQLPPGREAKLIRCTRGRVFDVIVDLRPGSPTFCKWLGTELDPTVERCLYVPEGFAHGFVTLEDETELHYQMSASFRPELERGIRYDDPLVAIRWPITPAILSDRDRSFPLCDRDALRRLLVGDGGSAVTAGSSVKRAAAEDR